MSTVERIAGIILGFIIGVILTLLIGCQPNSNIKITYGEWESKIGTVVNILPDNLIVIEVDGVNFTLESNGQLIGNKISVEIRDVWKTKCQGNTCELLDTNQEIRIVDDLVV